MIKKELKFRVWNPSNNSFLDLSNGGWGYYYLTLDGKFMVHYTGTFGNPSETKHLDYMVVQQYTTAADKNGKEIYEGDIINYRGRIGTVEFFATMYICCWDDQTDDELAYMMIGDIEVIGNIFEPSIVIPTTIVEDKDLEQCDENAWDGSICRSCGMKNI